MVHRPSDSRLLNSLLSNEKEYHKQLLALVDNYSQHSLTAFAAYASASPAPVARAVIAVAGSFAGADDALRRYAVSVEAWEAELRSIKELEEEVGNVMRDREILFVHFVFIPHVFRRQQIPVQRDTSHQAVQAPETYTRFFHRHTRFIRWRRVPNFSQLVYVSHRLVVKARRSTGRAASMRGASGRQGKRT